MNEYPRARRTAATLASSLLVLLEEAAFPGAVLSCVLFAASAVASASGWHRTVTGYVTLGSVLVLIACVLALHLRRDE